MFINLNLFKHIIRRYHRIKNTLLSVSKGDKMAKNYVTVSNQIIKLGSLFLMPGNPRSLNMEDIVGLVPFVVMVIGINKDHPCQTHIYLLILGLDEAIYHPIEIKQNHIVVNEKRGGATTKTSKNLLPSIIHNMKGRRCITDEGLELYSRIITTTPKKLSNSEFVSAGIRIVDIKEWPTYAIETWASRHMGLASKCISSITDFMVDKGEAINQLLISHLSSERHQNRDESKKEKPVSTDVPLASLSATYTNHTNNYGGIEPHEPSSRYGDYCGLKSINFRKDEVVNSEIVTSVRLRLDHFSNNLIIRIGQDPTFIVAGIGARRPMPIPLYVTSPYGRMVISVYDYSHRLHKEIAAGAGISDIERTEPEEIP